MMNLLYKFLFDKIYFIFLEKMKEMTLRDSASKKIQKLYRKKIFQNDTNKKYLINKDLIR